MNGFISKTLAALCFGGGLAVSGCYTYDEVVDPCYPQRYMCTAKREVQAAFGPQACNGHVLDQTMWNSYFEAGTDRLTPGGMDHLAYIARRRPGPDAKVYLQTAQDITYDPGVPARFVEARNNLDHKRIDAIHKYLSAQTDGRPVAFEVIVHDPAEPGIPAIPMNIAIQQKWTGFRGNLPVTAAAPVLAAAAELGRTDRDRHNVPNWAACGGTSRRKRPNMDLYQWVNTLPLV